MTDPSPLPGNEPIKQFSLQNYSKQDLIVIVSTTLEKAKDRHQEARRWEARYRALEAELKALEAAQGLP